MRFIGCKALLLDNIKSVIDENAPDARFNHIILSYSTDGLMSVEEIERTMKKYGDPNSFKIYWIPYRRYKSRSTETKEEKLKEMLVYIRKD